VGPPLPFRCDRGEGELLGVGVGGMALGMSRYQRVTEEKVAMAKALRKNATPSEKMLWEALRGRQLKGAKFRRQQVIRGFIVDFYTEAANLAIELDGSAHDSPEAQAKDKAREAVLQGAGVRILRFDNEAVLGDLPTVLETIQRHL